MVQLPVAVGVRLDPETEQVPETLAKESDPLPEPPLVERAKTSP